MSRIIMLIPLDQDVGLTSISLSMIYFFNRKKYKDKSILYFSCRNNSLDYTTLIIDKYFSQSVSTLHNIDFSNVFFNSCEYFSLLNEIIEKCHQKKTLYELILIEGLKPYHINSEKINHDIAQNTSAEVIFVSNLVNSSKEHVEKKENSIQLFLETKKYKNFLGVIFNNINSPFIEKNYDFIKKLIILKKIKNSKENLFIIQKTFTEKKIPIIACIPWKKNMIRIFLRDINNFLNLKSINFLKKEKCFIEEVIIFDESYISMKNRVYSNTLIIVSFSRIESFLNIFSSRFNSSKISGIILTGVLKSKRFIISLCQGLIFRSISIFFTNKNTMEILSKLQIFNFDINIKNRLFIEKLQKYISSFFSHSSIFISTKISNQCTNFSPKEFFYHLKSLSKENNKRIILPESYESRILQAASICQNDNIAECVLLGDPEKILIIAKNNGIKLNKNIEIINPLLIRNKYISRFIEIRKDKGLDEYSAKKKLEENIFLATLILESNQVDGLVSGAVNTTANTIRPALQIIKTNFNNSLVSSIFFMLLPNQVLVYGDCAINVDPTAEELSEIAIQSADSAKMFGIEPRIAMLSYSTGYSASGYQVEKVRNATTFVKIKRPDLIIDGPIQYDAAVSEIVAKFKTPFSPILGNATVFVFPDLNSGNIAYKAVQRSANIVSIGPMLQGLKKPVNDLSRGASVEEIIYTIALTSIQSL